MIKLIRQTSLPFKITFNFRTPRCFSQPTFSTSLSSQHLSISPPHFTPHAYAISLQSSIRNGDQLSGKSLHAHIIKSGNSLDVFGFNVLLNFYVKFDFLDDACKLFDEMTERNTVSFVTLLQGYSRCNMFYEGVGLFSRLHREGYELNAFVFSSVLKFVAGTELEELGYVVHGCVLKLGLDSDSFVGTALIDAYSIFGDVVGARQVFDGIGDKDMVSWTGMLACYAENGCFEESLSMFSLMRNNGFKPNNFTFAGVLKACVGLESFEVGKTVHGCVVKMCYERDTYVGTGLLELYTQLGDDGDIILLFKGMPKNDVVSWSFMIARYAQRDKSEEAVEMFCRMRQALVVPNQFTMTSMLQACAGMEGLELGMQIHCHVLKFGLDVNIFVSNALMDMYAKCGRLETSTKIFAELPNKNDVAWNTLIVGCVQSGDEEKALILLKGMLESQVQPTEVTLSSVLRACASLAAQEMGIQIHSLSAKTINYGNIVVSNSLIDMYAKCGSIKDARLVFDILSKSNEVTWNTMISGYSMHGLAAEALKVFEMMQQSECKPNKITFLGVLSACSNAGLLKAGQIYFQSMVHDHFIEPCMEHYTCMVSLLGRSGHLDKAVILIKEMPFQPSVSVWRALLGACVTHKNVELARMSVQRILEIEPNDDASHVLLSNLYATSRMWNNVASVRETMMRKRVQKEPGLSWIESQGIVHYFSVSDTSHPDMKVINGLLEWLNMKTSRAGYVPNDSAVLLDIDNEGKKRHLWLHSERLALAYALFKTSSRSQVRIIKNLRICVDCHTVIKLISEIVQRDIIIRDVNRFHHFHNGICTCGDYW